jgi:hypothetical protein
MTMSEKNLHKKNLSFNNDTINNKKIINNENNKNNDLKEIKKNENKENPIDNKENILNEKNNLNEKKVNNDEKEIKNEKIEIEEKDLDFECDNLDDFPPTNIFFPLNKYKNKELTKIKLPCSSLTAFKILFSYKSDLEIEFAKIAKNFDNEKNKWRIEKDLPGKFREIKFTTPMKSKFGPKCSRYFKKNLILKKI